MKRVLALDLGEVRVGVAVSDPLGITSQGLETISVKSKRQLMGEIAAVVREQSAGEIVLGWPVNMDGTAGPGAREAEKFAEELRRKFKIPVILRDERLSTAQAEKMMLEGNLSRAKRRKRIDRVAAQLILQNYLASIRTGKETSRPDET